MWHDLTLSRVEVAARLAKAETIRLVQRSEEFGQGDTQPPGDPIQEIEAGCLTAPLQVRQIRPGQARAVGQFFLREARSCT